MSDPMDEDALRASLFAIFGMSRTDEDLAIQRASMDYHYSGGQNLGTAPNPIPPHPSSPTAAHNPHHNVASQGHQHKPNMMDLLKTTKFEKEALEKEAEEITVDAPAKFHVTVKSTFSTDFEIVVGFSDGTIHLVKFDGTVHRRWDPSIGKRGKIGYDFASSLVLAPNTVFYGSNNHVLGLQTTFRDTISIQKDMHAGITAGVTKPRISQIVLIPDKILLRSVVQMFKVLIASDGYARFDGWPGRQGVDVFLGNGTPQIATRVIGKHLITAGTDGTICAWDWMKGERLWRSNQDFTVEEGHDATGDGDRKYKMSCAEHAHEEVSRDGGVPCINHWAGKIGVGNQDGLIRILKIQDGTKIAEMATDGSPIVGLFHINDRDRYISCSKDGIYRVWNSKTYEMMHVVKAFSEGLKFCGLFWDIVIGVGENIDQWSQGNGDVIRGWKVVDDPLKDDVFWEESGFGAHFGGLNVLSDRFIVCVVRDGEWVFETYDVKA